MKIKNEAEKNLAGTKHDAIVSDIEFSKIVFELVKDSNNELDHIEAFVIVCEQLDIEIESSAELITPPLKAKLKIDAEQKNWLPKTSRLGDIW